MSVGPATDEWQPRQSAHQVANLMFDSRLGCLTVSALLLALGLMVGARGQSSSQGVAALDRPISLDIPAQPLASALESYTALTGLQALYDSELATSRRSTAVKGLLMPDVALRVLLEGTGLTVLSTTNAFAIVPVPSTRQDNSKSLADHMPYLAIVQHDIERAFCRLPETMPGNYRVALRFDIGAAGNVLHPQLLSSTGDPRRDGLIADVLRDLSIEKAPPPGMSQPVTMIVTPRPPAQTGDCGSSRLGHD
jgi:hypothetical protein